MIDADVAAFDAEVTRRAPTVPWWAPLRIEEQDTGKGWAVWFWRCRLCWVRVGVVQFPTRTACLDHLEAVHGVIP
jgi:hypothetical protein